MAKWFVSIALCFFLLLSACATPPAATVVDFSDVRFSTDQIDVNMLSLMDSASGEWSSAGDVPMSVPLQPEDYFVEAGREVLSSVNTDLLDPAGLKVSGTVSFLYAVESQAFGSLPTAAYAADVTVTTRDGRKVFTGEIAAEVTGERLPLRAEEKIEAAAREAARTFWRDVVAAVMTS